MRKGICGISLTLVVCLIILLLPLQVFGAQMFDWPLDTQHVIKTGFTDYANHNGVDMPAPSGTPVYAIFDGTAVFYQAYTTVNGVKYLTSYGNHIWVTSADGMYSSLYAHLNAFEGVGLTIPSSQTRQQSGNSGKYTLASRTVKKGDLLGYVGTTGNSTGNHLHFGLKINGSYVDPEQYLNPSKCAGNSGAESCNCSTSYAGNYICTTSSQNLNIRSGHGSSYGVIGSIPSGATVYVSKASGTGPTDWGHVEYNGVTGYASMEYLTKHGHNPHGVLDSLSGGTHAINVGGWAFDRDDMNTPLEIHVYVGDQGHAYRIKANLERQDVNKEYGCGNYHGFAATINVDSSLIGNQKVDVYACNIGGGANVLLGSGTVNISADTEPPTISDVQVYDITSTGYTVACSVRDNTGINVVQFPTWTEPEQDEITWGEGTHVGNNENGAIFIARVDIGQHNNERNNYTTHIWAWDNYGNASSVSIPEHVTVWPEKPADLGTKFTALIFNEEAWMPIENKYEITGDTMVKLAKQDAGAYQLWYFDRQDDGSYIISSCYDGRNLDVLDASTEWGAKVQTHINNGHTAQRWFLYEYKDGYVIRTKLSDCVLEIPGNDTSVGTGVRVYTCNGSDAQIWSIYKGDDCKLGTPKLSVSVDSIEKCIQFDWARVYGAKAYDIRILKTGVSANEEYCTVSGVSPGYNIVLPEGNYQAYIEATHYYDVKTSNIVEFAVAHSHSYISETVTPDCINHGYTTYLCSECGESYVDDYVSPLGHDYLYSVFTVPTEINTGALKGVCSRCLNAEEISLPCLNTTDYSYIEVKEPTYSEDGVGRYIWNTTTYGTFCFDVSIPKLEAVLLCIEIVSVPQKTVYEIGDTLDTTGLTLQAAYSDGSRQIVTEGYEVSGFDSSTPGEKVAMVTYQGKTAEFTVTVNETVAPEDQIVLELSEGRGVVGSVVRLKLHISNLPEGGISSLDLSLDYDPTQLKLTSVPEDGGILGEHMFGNNIALVPYGLTWNNLENITAEGILATLEFEILRMPEDGVIKIRVTGNECADLDENIYAIAEAEGVITKGLPGDVNGDGKITQIDVTRIRKYLAGGWDVEIDEAAADVNGDGKITQIDVTRLRKYLAGGWDVILG